MSQNYGLQELNSEELNSINGGDANYAHFIGKLVALTQSVSVGIVVQHLTHLPVSGTIQTLATKQFNQNPSY